ncbi:MAG: hypothetical protein JHC98_00510 [Thermoleophilaceae bacterium]|nr:hypothetical protein [Thermoleophilaceae bacterium]
MTTRIDAVRIRACLTFALTLAFFAFVGTGQAAAADFTWSSSVSTTQAGGHPNLTLNYASSSTQSLTRLDVDLPQGMMHRNRLSGACSNPLYLADNCPAGSTLGTVSARIVVARVPVTVAGTIYQLAEPTGDADATFGIVLRPPLSALGLTGKIFVRNQISFTNGGGLRSSLVGPLDSVTVLGATLPSRISQLRLTYNAQTPTGGLALISNPTGCKSQAFTVRGTFSDGSTRDHSSSFTTTGCPAVPFAPTAGAELDNNFAGERSSFALLLGNNGSSSVSALHAGHVVVIGHDFSEVGEFDFEQIDGGVLCSDGSISTPEGCPAASQLGEISADIEGFGTVTGKTFATFSPGHKTISEITLRQGVTVRFAGEIGGADKSTISFTGLPQLPITAFRFRATKPILRLNNTCAIRLTRMSSHTFGDGHAVNQVAIPAAECRPPAAPTITDGPDRGITINTSHVEYRFTGKEVDTAWECAIDDGPFAACASPFVDDWQGEGAHSFSVRGVRGGLTGPATTATFSIDTIPPTVSFVGDEYTDADGDGVADKPFRPDDFEFTFDVADDGSGLNFDKLDAAFQSASDPDAPSTRSVKQPRPHTQGHVQVGGAALAPPGPGTATATAVDLAGNATTIAIGLIIDSEPPEVVINERRAHFTDASNAEVPIEISDDSLKYPQGEVTAECERKGWDGTVKGSAKIVTDRDTGRSKGFCSFTDVPEGSFKVTVRGWDPVKKESVAEGDLIVDRSPPEIKFTNPEDADADNDGFADGRFRPASFEVPAEFVDDGSGVDPDGSTCRGKGIVKGIGGTVTPNGMTCTLEGLPDGDVEVEFAARNYVGTVTIVKRSFTVDTTGPTLSFVEPGDLDADGDGFADERYRAAQIDFEVRADDPGSGVDPNSGACRVTPRKGGVVTGTIIINNGSLRCSFADLPDGDADVEIRAADHRGHVTVLKAAVTVDTTPPAMSFVDPGDLDADGDGFSDNRVRAARIGFEVLVEDQGSGVDSNSGACVAKPRKGGVITGSVIISNGNLRCSLENLPDGDTDIEIRAADHRGHVTVLKAAVTVESPPPPVDPVLTITAPSSGQSITQGSSMMIGFSMVGTGPFTYRCAVDNIIVLASCVSGASISTAGMSTGTHILKVVAYDAVGSYEATRAFNIVADDSPPVCAAIYPPPPGCPGYIPPGGGGVITLP